VRENKEREREGRMSRWGRKHYNLKVVWGPFHGIVWTIVDDVCIIIFFIFLGGNLGQ
jgi:hypothetical protein